MHNGNFLAVACACISNGDCGKLSSLFAVQLSLDYLVYDFATVHRADRFIANPISKYKLFSDIEVGPSGLCAIAPNDAFLKSHKPERNVEMHMHFDELKSGWNHKPGNHFLIHPLRPNGEAYFLVLFYS